MLQDIYNKYRDLVEMPDQIDSDKLSHEERHKLAMMSAMIDCITYMAAILTGLLLCVLFGSCTTTKYVPVTETHAEHHWHTDSVKERDSVHTESNTIIRELDSAAMAKYGIQMQNNQRAWLVLQREMENRLRELEHMTATRDTIHDSIPQPYPVVKEVPAELTWWQQTCIECGKLLMFIILVCVILLIVKLLKWKIK